jgi:phospholipid/cholesterol/gamma-HCH transport system permease protein
VPMRQYGAELYVADLLGLAVLRELGPLITAILLAGRTGAAYAAELGTMKVNEEISALTTMGLDPVRFLVTPRVIACVLMTPLLAVYADLIALIGGAVTMLTFNIPLRTFYAEAVNIVSMTDFLGGLVKAIFFGLLISGVGCLRGLQTGTGASAVGDSATRAVVSSLVLIVAVDGMFALIYWVLDI